MHFIPLAIAFMITLTGCASFQPFGWAPFGNHVPEAPEVDLPSPMLSIHSEEITAIVQDYTVELRALKRLHLLHANTYYNERGIQAIQLQFHSQDIINLCQARKLIIDISEGLLEKLNSNSLLTPETENYAFYPFNLEIYINFESFYIRYVDPFYIKWVTMEDSEIVFYTGDVDDNDKKCWHSKKESYETSRNIVLYQRAAEDNFKGMTQPNRAIFGDKRFYPDESDILPKVLE